MIPQPPRQGVQTWAGTIRLFRLAGISVHLHWLWILVAFYVIQNRAELYTSQLWNVAEYLALFAIVLCHEFGHALACRQVGGSANRILLWPLGGVAYVQPPPRPGAVLWSIAAGPLVNVILLPILYGALVYSILHGWNEILPDVHNFLETVFAINLLLLVFNMLPIYPLDGGQILQAILWFFIGRARSLRIVSVLGLGTAVLAIGLAFSLGDLWMGILSIFVGFQSWKGYRQARMLSALDQIPRHTDVKCPSCGEGPLRQALWTCGECRTRFDPFVTRAHCPHCGHFAQMIPCPFCLKSNSVQDWYAAAHRPSS